MTDQTSDFTPEEENAARRISRVLGLDFDEICAYEMPDGLEDHCNSGTCPGALTEDHDADDSRSTLLRMARAALTKDA